MLGIDGAATAIERAQAKAEQRGLSADFTATYRRAYTQQLAAVLPAGGWVHLLEISEQATGPFPSVTSAEIVDAFDHKWINAQIQNAIYSVTTGEVPAWLVSIQRR